MNGSKGAKENLLQLLKKDKGSVGTSLIDLRRTMGSKRVPFTTMCSGILKVCHSHSQIPISYASRSHYRFNEAPF